LCLSAAGRESLKNRLAFVFAFGSHCNLDRTMEYLVSGELPDHTVLPPHVYGQAVLLRRFADRFVEPDRVEALREVLLVYLQEKFEETQTRLGTLEPDSQRLIKLCLDRNTEELGKVLAPIVRSSSSDPSLSPSAKAPPACPIFLLHGSLDNVIPAFETLNLHAWAAPSTETHALVSELIQHVEMGENSPEVSVGDYWAIIRFWTEMLK